MLSSMFPSRTKPVLLSGLVCALLVGCTLAMYQFARQQEHARIARSFDELAVLKAQRVQLRVDGYARTLLDLRGLFVADGDVTEDEFRRYLRGIEVAQRYPALLRIGYAPRVTPATRARIESRLRQAGADEVLVQPDDLPILYGFPANDAIRGKRLNEGQLRAAPLGKARDTDQPQMSPRMPLRFDPGRRPGFVMYLPLYGNDLAPPTVEQRRRALSGYLFAVFSTEELIESTIGPDLARQMGLALFDGPLPDPATLAYESGPSLPSAPGGARLYASTQNAEIGGRPWTFLFVARPAFVREHQSLLPVAVLGGGLLASVLAGWLAHAVACRLQAEGRVRHLAYHDELTDLPNRQMLRLCIRDAIRREQDTRRPCALIIVELIRFRDINYTLGHLIGDEVLKQASARIRRVAERGTTVARISNVQFGILLPDAGEDQAADLARRLVDALEQPLSARSGEYELGARAGIVSVPLHGCDSEDLMRHADIALNLARASGRAYVIYDAGLDPYKPQRLALLGAFRQAVKEGQLQLYCQPKADLRTGMITSVEALVRWQHPDYGLVMPAQFLSLIEPTELIHVLTERMLASAMRQCHAWRADGLDLPLAVNLSTRNLLNPALPDFIGGLMHAWEASPGWVELEITESSIMEDPVASIRVLNQLHAMGLKLSVDDFGTGYSSLSYLMKLPVAVIKIDTSFTLNMMRDADAASIVKAMVDLAHTMGMKVVAEGAATREIWDALVRLDCDEAQGYYISPPLPAQSFRTWLERSPWRLEPGLLTG